LYDARRGRSETRSFRVRGGLFAPLGLTFSQEESKWPDEEKLTSHGDCLTSGPTCAYRLLGIRKGSIGSGASLERKKKLQIITAGARGTRKEYIGMV